MKVLCSIIALPITILISIICFLFVLTFESDFKEKNGESAFARIWKESKNLTLTEAWNGIPELVQAIIAAAIYYVLFF